MYKYYVFFEVHRRLLKYTNIIFSLRYTGGYWNVQILCFLWGTQEVTEIYKYYVLLLEREVVTEMYKYYIWLEVHGRVRKCTNIIFDLRYRGCYLNVQILYLTCSIEVVS